MGNKKIAMAMINNEEGSTIVLALIILAILTIIGISSSTTSTIELQIVRNERIRQSNFYFAEAAAFEAAQRLNLFDSIADYNELMPNSSTFAWINDGTSGTAIDFEDSGLWDSDGALPDNSTQSLMGAAGECSYAAAYMGKQAGSSLKTGELSVNLYTVYGLSQHNNGEVLIDIGSKKPVTNP